MAITDELREYANIATGRDIYAGARLCKIADRIDAAHRSALEKLAAQLDDTGEMREFCERLEEAAKGHEDVQLWGVDYTPTEGEKGFADSVPAMFVQCPVDADGLPIHIGDVMEWPTTGETFEVVGIGDGTLFYVDGGCDECADWTGASTKRHHHEPTVEDVLEDFYRTAKADSDANMGDLYETIAEYAKRLRLAEEEK